MATPTIGQVLLTNREKKLKEMTMMREAIRLSTHVTFPDDMSLSEVYKELKEQDPDALSNTINEALNPGSRSVGRNIMTVIMSLMLILMATSICAVNIYISLKTSQPIQWSNSIICLSCPILIVLHDRGLLRKENKDVLLALLGRPPIPTFGEAIAQRYSQPVNTYVPENNIPSDQGNSQQDRYGY